MAEIVLTNGDIAHVDDDVLPLVKDYNWRMYEYDSKRHIIADVCLAGERTTIRLPRVILGVRKGKKCIYRDGNVLNNRRENLKLMSPKAMPRGYTRWRIEREAIDEESHTQL